MIEVSDFTVAVLSAMQKPAAKQYAPVLEMLRSDVPLDAQDKTTLADFIETLVTPGQKGRRQEPLYSPTWWKRRIAERARDLQRNVKKEFGKKLSLVGAIELTLQILGKDKAFSEQQIIDEINRSKQPRKRRGK